MKKAIISTTVVLLLIGLHTFAQTPEKMKYQAIARDNAGNVLNNQLISFRISILQGSASGTLVYSETHLVTTNQFGLASMEIGNGTVISGVFADIDWGGNIYFLQIEIDENGTYQLMGTSQLLSVPYSLYSETSGNAGANEINELADGRTVGNSVFLGSGAGVNDDGTNNHNVAVGDSALTTNISGIYNTANGSQSLYSNTIGTRNTANGNWSLYSNTEGDYNTANGYKSLYSNTWGYRNTANGYKSLHYNTWGYYNTANGNLSLYSNTSGYYNTANGSRSLYSNTTGVGNTANGLRSLYSNTTGDFNTANGNLASYYTLSSYNTSVGYSAGDFHTFSSGTFLGAEAYPGVDGISNCMALGYNARVSASNRVVIGNTSVTSIGGYAGWTDFSDGRYKRNVNENVPGLEFIKQLRPVTYNLDIKALNAELNKNKPTTLREGEQPSEESPDDRAGIASKEQILYTGFIAQEVEETANKIGYNFSGVDVPQSADSQYGLRYAEFVVPLVKAVQEQQQLIEELTNENKQIKDELTQIKLLLIKNAQK